MLVSYDVLTHQIWTARDGTDACLSTAALTAPWAAPPQEPPGLQRLRVVPADVGVRGRGRRQRHRALPQLPAAAAGRPGRPAGGAAGGLAARPARQLRVGCAAGQRCTVLAASCLYRLYTQPLGVSKQAVACRRSQQARLVPNGMEHHP
jgi:hypothetical protein